MKATASSRCGAEPSSGRPLTRARTRSTRRMRGMRFGLARHTRSIAFEDLKLLGREYKVVDHPGVDLLLRGGPAQRSKRLQCRPVKVSHRGHLRLD